MNIRLPESLTSDEIIELFKKYEKGNEKIRNKLIEGNLRLVNSELKKFYSLVQDASHIELEDLFEIGCIGLIKAVDSFDYKQEFKFSPYAVKCINHEIFMYLRKLKVRRISEITSLNVPIGNDIKGYDDDSSKIDLVMANDNVEETCIKNEIRKIVREAIDILPDFEKNLRQKVLLYSDKIRFTGYVPYRGIWKYYKLADVAVLPSVWEEPAGLTMIEACVAATPLITTKSGGIPEYIHDDFAVLLERDENLVQNIAESINMVLANEEEFRRKAHQASLYVKEHFSKEVFYNTFVKVLE